VTDRPPAVEAGVIGVGTMGGNHARVYHHLAETELAGVADADRTHAEEVAATYETDALGTGTLLDRVDVVSVAVPTEYHYETVRACIQAGVDVLVEKPFVDDPEDGRALIDLADERDVTLQVGHIERFNPAVQTLTDIVDDLDVIAISAERLSPPLDRDIDDSAVLDLMIHDLDVLLSLVDAGVSEIGSAGTRNGRYASATIQFESGVIGQLTASRVTQEKVRKLSLTAESCRITVDYTDQSIEIHRRSTPEYVRENGNLRYHHENVVERLAVENREPLKHEIESFVEAARTGTEPVVTAEDGLAALELARSIDRAAADDSNRVLAVSR